MARLRCWTAARERRRAYTVRYVAVGCSPAPPSLPLEVRRTCRSTINVGARTILLAIDPSAQPLSPDARYDVASTHFGSKQFERSARPGSRRHAFSLLASAVEQRARTAPAAPQRSGTFITIDTGWRTERCADVVQRLFVAQDPAHRARLPDVTATLFRARMIGTPQQSSGDSRHTADPLFLC
jgi:hypothetical protein